MAFKFIMNNFSGECNLILLPNLNTSLLSCFSKVIIGHADCLSLLIYYKINLRKRTVDMILNEILPLNQIF